MTDNLLQLAIQAARAGEVEKARACFAEIVRTDPRSEAGWLGLGECLSDPEKKRFCYQRVLEIDPANAPARRALAALVRPIAPSPTPTPPQPSFRDRLNLMKSAAPDPMPKPPAPAEPSFRERLNLMKSAGPQQKARPPASVQPFTTDPLDLMEEPAPSPAPLQPADRARSDLTKPAAPATAPPAGPPAPPLPVSPGDFGEPEKPAPKRSHIVEWILLGLVLLLLAIFGLVLYQGMLGRFAAKTPTATYGRFPLRISPPFSSAGPLSTQTPAPSPTPSLTGTPTPTGTSTGTATSTLAPAEPTAFIPPGPALLFLSQPAGSQSQLSLLDVDSGNITRLTNGSIAASNPGWTPDGWQIVYQLAAGQESQILIMRSDGTGAAELSRGASPDDHDPVVSPDGTHIAFFADYSGAWNLYLMKLDGTDQHSITGNTVDISTAAWSPDSTTIAFTPMHNTESPSFIASVKADGSSYTELTSSEAGGDNSPVWSPDGKHLLFDCYVGGLAQICMMDSNGANRKVLTHAPGGNTGPVWSPDGTRIAFVSSRDSAAPDTCTDTDCNDEIYVMNADGSAQTRLTNDPAEDWSPAWSPDGQQIAFVSLRDEPRNPKVCGNTCNSEIYLMNADGSQVTRLTNNTTPDWDPVWRPVPVGPEPAVTPTGTPGPVTRIGGGQNQLSYWAQVNSPVYMYLAGLGGQAGQAQLLGEGSSPAWSPDGAQVVYVGTSTTELGNLYIMDADGEDKRQLTSSGKDNDPVWSPDGQRILFSRGGSDLYTIDLDGTQAQLLLSGGGGTYYGPAWSPDGKQIAFLKGSENGFQTTLMVAGSDGSNPHVVTADSAWNDPPDWSPDGQWIVYTCTQPEAAPQAGQVCKIKPDGSQEQILTSISQNGSPSWSPDGKWIAFISHRDNLWQVYIMHADGTGEQRVSNDWNNDFQPRWRP
ncbi:MAG: hypothetical protein WCE68_16865 [Anaerolineales bacterium]